MNRAKTYENYMEVVDKLHDAAKELMDTTSAGQSLTFAAFCGYWNSDYGALKIAKIGSEFCDPCTSIRYDLSSLTGETSDTLL